MVNLKHFIQFILQHGLFLKNEQILLAVSGGIDSTVMAHLFHEAQFRFAIAHCNFDLRGNESEDDEKFAESLAGQFKVQFFSTKFQTSDFAEKKRISIQMAARELRYDWFEQIRLNNKFDFIATAHHLDDQIETFLINLIRGTGLAGLHGIPVKNRQVIRPMMFTFRKDIEEYATERGISYRTDLSNNETKYLRNKLRHEVLPRLCSINPGFPQGLTETIRKISDFETIGNRALKEWTDHALAVNGTCKTMKISDLLKFNPVEPYAWAFLSPFGFNETQVTNILESLLKKNRNVFCSPTHRLVKERGYLNIYQIEEKATSRPVKINSFEHKRRITIPLKLIFERFANVEFYKIPLTDKTASLDFEKLKFPLILRKWEQGDSFYPLGMKKKKKLSDFFIDQKFPMQEKEQTWLLCSGRDIVWIVGHRIDHRYRVTGSTVEILRIVTGF